MALKHPVGLHFTPRRRQTTTLQADRLLYGPLLPVGRALSRCHELLFVLGRKLWAIESLDLAPLRSLVVSLGRRQDDA
jgi:hypothetical protein